MKIKLICSNINKVGGPIKQINAKPIFQALFAAILFGVSAPLSKLLLDEIAPIPLAAFLYLGSGIGSLGLLITLKQKSNSRVLHPKFNNSEFPWLIGAIATGGVAAPIVLLLGLKQTPASTASILLNFESVATALIAFIAFKEPINRRVLAAISVITLASIFLSWTIGQWGLSMGALGIIGACFLWGMDNNFTRKISENDPRYIVTVKGLSAGCFSLLLGLFLRIPLPDITNILKALVIGSVSYGLSIQFFILAMRNLGAARTSAIFGIAPIFGLALSIILLGEKPQTLFWIALPMMMIGAWLMITENHEHNHVHEAVSHIHEHRHTDIHHNHPHSESEPIYNGNHSHFHDHSKLKHTHEHTPDSLHLHKHTD